MTSQIRVATYAGSALFGEGTAIIGSDIIGTIKRMNCQPIPLSPLIRFQSPATTRMDTERPSTSYNQKTALGVIFRSPKSLFRELSFAVPEYAYWLRANWGEF